MDGAGVDSNIMSDCDVVADMSWARFVGDVYARAILDVRAVADGDGGHITADHGVEPYGALVAHRHITYYRCVLTEITVLAPLGRKTFVTLD